MLKQELIAEFDAQTLAIQEADVLRATIAIADAWDSDEDYSIDTMCNHLEALIGVVDGHNTYADFVKETKLVKNSYLQ